MYQMTLSSFLSKLIGVEASNIPNSFTIEMGKTIREMRLEARLSQSELGKLAYFHQASISQIENGKREVSSSELLYLSSALNKPILSFFPPGIRKYFEESPQRIEELTLIARKLEEDDLARLIIQARALADQIK